MTFTLARPVEPDSALTSPYGARAIGFHNGIDFGWRTVDPTRTRRVYAAADGVVEEVGWNDLVGWFVLIRHDKKHKTRYCHFAERPDLRVGQKVKTGHYLGQMGATGSQAAGIHLHFDLLVNGVRVDPEPYFAKPKPANVIDQIIQEAAVQPIIIHRKEGGDEWMLAHLEFRGPSEKERGYITTTVQKRAITWTRLFSEGWVAKLVGAAGRYKASLSRADFIDAQEALRDAHDAIVRGRGE